METFVVHSFKNLGVMQFVGTCLIPLLAITYRPGHIDIDSGVCSC